MRVKKSNVGKPITTHAELQKAVKDKKWIVIKTGNFYDHYVAAAFVNRRYVEVVKYLKTKQLFIYKKNKI